MRRGIRQKIIQQSINLLNEKGLGNMVLRDVSDALGISVGNLTYYFPKWEDIMDAAMQDYRAYAEKMAEESPADLYACVEYLDRVYDMQAKYSFLFSNYAAFFRMYPSYVGIRNLFLYEKTKEIYQFADAMMEKGYLHKEGPKHDYDLLIKNLWFFLSGWHDYSSMYAWDELTSKDTFYRSLWNIMLTHLTAKGREVVIQAYSDYMEVLVQKTLTSDEK